MGGVGYLPPPKNFVTATVPGTKAAQPWGILINVQQYLGPGDLPH